MAEPRAFTLPPGGGSAITLPVGTGPKPGGGIPHTFQNVGDGPGKLLIISAPSASKTSSWSTRDGCPEPGYGSACA
jgi:hypothetical protein